MGRDKNPNGEKKRKGQWERETKYGGQQGFGFKYLEMRRKERERGRERRGEEEEKNERKKKDDRIPLR